MVGGLAYLSPGILGLLDLVEDHWEALDYTLLELGLDLNDLGTERLSWSRLWAVVRWSPSTSALSKSMHGEDAEWSIDTHLLASAVDALRAGNWQRGGGKGKRPKPVERPGKDDQNKKTYGGSRTVPLDEAKEMFDRINRAPAGTEPDAADGVPVTCDGEGCGRTDIHARSLCGMHYQRWRRAYSKSG